MNAWQAGRLAEQLNEEWVRRARLDGLARLARPRASRHGGAGGSRHLGRAARHRAGSMLVTLGTRLLIDTTAPAPRPERLA